MDSLSEIDHIDLMVDEFKRIAACPGADAEIRDLCQRAITRTVQNVPVIQQRDEAIRARRETDVYAGLLRDALAACEEVMCFEWGGEPLPSLFKPALDKARAALEATRGTKVNGGEANAKAGASEASGTVANEPCPIRSQLSGCRTAAATGVAPGPSTHEYAIGKILNDAADALWAGVPDAAHQAEHVLAMRALRLLRLLNLDAPAEIVANERELVRKSLDTLYPILSQDIRQEPMQPLCEICTPAGHCCSAIEPCTHRRAYAMREYAASKDSEADRG